MEIDANIIELNATTKKVNFTATFPTIRRYEMIRITDSSLEPRENKKGLFNYLWDQVEYRSSRFITSVDLVNEMVKVTQNNCL